MTMIETKAGLGVVLTTAWLAAYGCRFSEVDTTHCNYNDGDAYCAQKYPDGSYPFCETGLPGCVSRQRTFGCTAERPGDECYSPCGGASDITEDATCLDPTSSASGSSGSEATDASGESSGTDTGQTTGTTGPQPCVSNEECTDTQRPLCDTNAGECVTCSEVPDPGGACAGLDPSEPLCVEGACVACTGEDTSVCDGQALVCDEQSNACVPCTAHEQCGEAACNLFTGACLPADGVVRVGSGQEYATLTEAVMSIPAGGEATLIVHAGMPNYDEAVTVDGGRVVAFLAADDVVTPPRWALLAGGSPQLTVTDGTVLMEGIQVSSNGSSMHPGVLVDGGRAWLDRSRVVQNTGGGVVANNAAELVLRSSFVGGDVNNVDAVRIDGADATITYSTLGAGVVSTTGLACTSPGTVIVRNSFIVSLGNMGTGGVDVACDRADITFTATEVEVTGEGNEALGELPLMTPGDWFMDYASGDYHLTTPPIVVTTTARWTEADPLTDIDGEPRVGIDGAPDVAGADVP